MPCYKPLAAYHGPGGVKFKRSESFGTPIELPCRRCIGCRLEYAKEWALRCHHESSLYLDNAFLTLTYDDNHLPDHGGLKHEHFQKFIRALRKKEKRQNVEEPIRYFMCGEYGSRCQKHELHDCPDCGSIQRPHYHAILFNYAFDDAYLSVVRNGNRCYRSGKLEKLWYHGTSEISDVTFQSAGYVARYVLKKQNGDYGKRAYGIPDPETGELTTQKKAPYTAMSLKPGIGKKWYEKNRMDLWPHDFAVLPDGRQTTVPAYYRKILEKEDPALANSLRMARVAKAKSSPDNTPERLATRESCKNRQAERLQRNL